MAVFKCKICGGSLDVADSSSIAVCDYCGTKQTVPTTKDDVVANLFNRANNLRLKCEFDKAEQLYEKVLDIDDTDSEAHWGVVLCKYGIEYVEDKNTNTMVPTCHRTLYDAVLTDIDYLAAIENADAEQKQIYEAEARVIDKLQKNILNIVNNEEPFDVFICYKETDENGKRTVDSAIANDIYYQLTQEGFKVFYAPITLEDKLGYEYEPYIFAALSSAKVMLVVGTKPEYFDSVWVRNEWSRYLRIMKTDRSKLLIPCYKDMDAYELPDEFAHLQAQDMGKIGFISDVIRGLKKVISPNEQQISGPVKKKKVKVKKPGKLKKIWDSCKSKMQERAKYCLKLPLGIASTIFCWVSSFVYLFIIIWLFANCSDRHTYDSVIFTAGTIWGMILPIMVIVKFIKNKYIAVALQMISVIVNVLSVCVFNDIPYMVEAGWYFFVLLFTLLSFIWFIIICFSKKVEKATIKKHNPGKIILPAVLLSVLVIGTMELGGIDFCNYQIAKVFYNIGEYEYAYDGFTYLDDYKDSDGLANKSRLAEIKNADLYDIIQLGDFDTNDFSSWYVISKEDDRVLLLREYSLIKTPPDCNILGGWENSSLREYLNGEYMDVAFDDYIKEHILTTQLVNSSDATDITEDKMFILSEQEVLKYFPAASKRTSCVSNSTLRNVEEGNIYTVFYNNSFDKIEYINGKIICKKEFGNSNSQMAEKYIYISRINNIFYGSYYPAMWLDVSEIND